jgi:soluble lytic murein transglycosylase
MSAQRSPAADRGQSGRGSYTSRGRSRGARGRDPFANGARGLAGAIATLALVAVLVAAVVSRVQHASPGSGLPLSDAAVIREQAADKHLDPALIAGVIYAETKFNPRTSSAGALGLMQILPATAGFIAHRSGGVRFTTSDLATPKINVAYGSWYLRYLLDRYEGDEIEAVAAYNGGLANVDTWLAKAREEGARLTVGRIPFPETREYVQRVMRAQAEYRTVYPHALGLR